MPARDPSEVTSLAEAFDFSTDLPQAWELNLIWLAVERELTVVSQYADNEARAESIPIAAALDVIRRGFAAKKDLTELEGRRIGINFEGTIAGKRRLLVKVGWHDGCYRIVTMHCID